MQRLLTLGICLLLPLAGIAATPPTTPSAAASTSNTDASIQQQMAQLQAQMRELAGKMATLSAKVGNDASASALSYLSDNKRGMLGMVSSCESKGMYVIAITPGGPAERAGLEPGDLITAINGRPISRSGCAFFGTPDAQSNSWPNLQPGKTIKLTVQRAGKTLYIKATPERFQSGNFDLQDILRQAEGAAGSVTAYLNSPTVQKRLQQQIDSAAREASRAHTLMLKLKLGTFDGSWRIMSPWWGLNLAPLNPELGHYFGTDHGVLVLSRDAKRYPELEPGDVITRVGNQSVASPQDALRAFRNAPDDKPVSVTVRRHDRTVELAFKTPPRWSVFPPPPPPPPVPPAPPKPPMPPAPPAPPTSAF